MVGFGGVSGWGFFGGVCFVVGWGLWFLFVLFLKQSGHYFSLGTPAQPRAELVKPAGDAASSMGLLQLKNVVCTFHSG